jgi:cysteine synthase
MQSSLADIVVPDDVAFEKIQLLEAYGATVEKGSYNRSSLPFRQTDRTIFERHSATSIHS